jgi:uncharacterized protein
MNFEYDNDKSCSNKDKHGIDFVEAQRLWDDVNRIEIPARVQNEARFLVIAQLLGRQWSAVITYRQNNIRIISVRRSTPKEIRIYEG